MRKWILLLAELSMFTYVSTVHASAVEQHQTIAESPSTKSDLEQKKCESRLQTPLHKFIPIVREELYGTRGGPALMTSRGEFFVSITRAARTGVYNFSQNKFLAFDDGLYQDTSDLYESRSGRVYFGFITRARFKVFDARTGRNLIDLSVNEIPGVSDLLEQLTPTSPIFRVLFFETSTGIFAGIVPRTDDLNLDEAFPITVAMINLRTGEMRPSRVPSGVMHYERMANGHAYGIGWAREIGGTPNTLFVYDLGLGRAVLSEKFGHSQDPPIIAAPLHLFFQAPRKPELVMVLNSPTGRVLRYEREDRQFTPIAGLSRATTAGIQFFNGANGRPWFVAVEGNENNSLAPDYYRLVVQPMTGLSGAFVKELTLENPHNDIAALEVIERRGNSRLFLAWERTLHQGKVRFNRVHIIDQVTHTHSVAVIPENWAGTRRRQTFWDPVKGVLYAYFVREEGTSPEIAEISR